MAAISARVLPGDRFAGLLLYGSVARGQASSRISCTMTRAALKNEIRRLPIRERVELLEELWREAEVEQPVLLDWQRELLEERLADAESNPDAWVSWEDAKNRLERLTSAGR
ncbi:MAG TPA: addiction module protein [Thermoanaerobaculia bacterium]|nr:addiction module protein [Thermoanaerobaculia bacterium]